MNNLATALADVLSANRNLCEREINEKYLAARLSDGPPTLQNFPLRAAIRSREAAGGTLDATIDELVGAFEEVITNRVISAVAAMAALHEV